MPLSPIIKPTIPFTSEAYENLKKEKNRLLELRLEVMARLKEAREQGDLKENGAYQYAKFELGNIGRQLRTLNHQIQNGFVVKRNTSAATTAQFGSLITLSSTDDKKELTFMLVSEFESNPTEKKLSTTSPIGAAVLGKKENDTVVVQTPKGDRNYTITKITY